MVRHELLQDLLVEAERSLNGLDWSVLLSRSDAHRLAFRELGLAIGIHGLPRIRTLAGANRLVANISDRMQQYQPLAEQIEAFWTDPAHRTSTTWIDHRDINMVMLATSLAPESYLRI